MMKLEIQNFVGGVVTKVFIQHSEYEKGVRHLYNVDGILSLSNSNSSIYTHGFIFCMKELIWTIYNV